MNATRARAESPAIPPADPGESIPAFALDTETTGLDPAEGCRIVSISLIPVPDDTRSPIPKPASSLVLPSEGAAWHADAARVHGFTRETLLSSGATGFREAWGPLSALFPPAGEPFVILAHNAPFDHAFLQHELSACDLSEHPAADPARWRCTLSWSRHHWPSAKRHNLDAVSRRLSIPARERRAKNAPHDAAQDALLLALCWQAAREQARPAAPDLFAAEHLENPQAELPAILALRPLTPEQVRAHRDFAATHGTRPVPGIRNAPA